MKADEQLAMSLAPLDGFLISGSRPRSVPRRPSGLEEFLASPPIPDEARSTPDESGVIPATAASLRLAIGEDGFQTTHARNSMNEDLSAFSTVAAKRPFLDAESAEGSPASRVINAEVAAMAVVEPRALVAPSDLLVQPPDRASGVDNRENQESGEVLRALVEEGGLVDPSPWFSAGLESNPPRESTAAAPSFGFRHSEPSVGPAATGFDWRQSDPVWDGGPEFVPLGDRLEDSSSEAFEEIEARLSRLAARLEGVVDRIESTASEPLSARTGGFRGRVDE